MLGNKVGIHLWPCVNCGQAAKKGWSDHIFFNCPIFCTNWKAKFCSWLNVLHPQAPFDYLRTDWIHRNFSWRIGHTIPMLLMSTLWPCWKETNARLFLNKHNLIRQQAIQSFQDWSVHCKQNEIADLRNVWSRIKRIPSVLQNLNYW